MSRAWQQSDFRALLQALLPQGKAWPRIFENQLWKLLDGAAVELVRVNDRGRDLLEEAQPAVTDELLPDWERVAGLPNDCAPAGQTKQERRAALVARLSDTGESTPAALIAAAEALGFATTVTEYKPFEAGHSTAGDPLSNDDWVFVLTINAPPTTVLDFRVGESGTGEQLRTWGNDLLECGLSQLRHAHWVMHFAYADALIRVSDGAGYYDYMTVYDPDVAGYSNLTMGPPR